MTSPASFSPPPEYRKPPISMMKGLPMTPETNLPISEPALQGVTQQLTTPDPTGVIPAQDEPQSMQRRLWVLYPLASLSISAISGGVNGALLGKLIASFPGGDQVRRRRDPRTGIVDLEHHLPDRYTAGWSAVGQDEDPVPRRRNIWIFFASIAASRRADRAEFRVNGSRGDRPRVGGDDPGRRDPRRDQRSGAPSGSRSRNVDASPASTG